MKRTGFIGTELIISMFLIITLISSVFSVGNIEKTLYSNIENQSILYEIKGFMLLAKSKCKINKNQGKLIYDKGSQKILFLDNRNNIEEEYILPNYVDLMGWESSLGISKSGCFTKGITITMKSTKSNFDILTVSVGVDSIRVNIDGSDKV